MKKFVVYFVMVMVLFGVMPGHKEAADVVLAPEPLVQVKLVNYLGDQSSISLKISGSYFLDGTSHLLINTKTYTVKVENKKLYIYDGNTVLTSGDTLSVTPINSSDRAFINNRVYMGGFTFTIEDEKYIRPINKIYLDDYLKSVVPAEVYASTWAKDALKAQAVAARSYALHWLNKRILDDTTYSQAYAGAGNLHPNTTAAVEETAGEVVAYNNKVIETVYSASNGGMTENNYNEWGTAPLPYFPIQADSYDTAIKWNYSLQKQQIDTTSLDLSHPEIWWNDTIEADSKIAENIKSWLNKNGYSNKQIKIVSIPKLAFYNKSPSGRVQNGDILLNFFVKDKVDVTGKLMLQTIEFTNVFADKIRPIIGYSIMQSNLISEMTETDDAYTLAGTGNGHGVGMSQHGANNRANAGFTYKDILSFYYPTTQILKQYEPVVKNNMKTGWIKQGSNTYYLNDKGSVTTDWLLLGGKWYYFDTNGVMKTGWIQDGTKRYYLNENGIMQTGWVQLGTNWYYFLSSGEMKTGWIQLGTTWYFLDSNGVMKTDWIKLGADWYYLDSSGAMKTGWIKLGADWYYLSSSGAMKTGWLQLGSTWYYLNSSGVMKTGWVQVGSAWYYFYSNGSMAYNTTIQGYKLGPSGAWIR
jgi:stage II sporulation protein D